MNAGTGFSVDLTALGSAARGITGVLDTLDTSAVNEIDGDPVSFGHDRLAGTVTDFRARWQRGVAILTQDSRQLADRLVQTIDTYRQVDARIVTTLQTAASIGDTSGAAL